VWLFVRSDCPVANRYAPEIERLYERYSRQGVEFRLVYPEAGLTAEAMNKHRKEYGYKIPALLDTGHEYVVRAGVHVTPEAAVFVRGQLTYSGRIDDWYADIGKARHEAARHDLEEVLAVILTGKAVAPRRTKAVGCAIENLQ
jgi:hypothetical protein